MNAPTTPNKLLPLAAMMLAGSLGTTAQVLAQEAPEKTLKTVTVRDTQESATAAKDKLLVTRTGIAKGNQALKDIPQTVTVMTEKLMDERNLDDFREVLKTTAGVTFMAGETGEEDVRMRGFSLGQAGDIYVDGLRDAPLIERDTFNLDRVEVLKGSASMLFGKGSTGGVVNQVNKQPFLMDQNEINVMAGSGHTRRITGDFNRQKGESSAVRLNVMDHQADNWGAKVGKKGVAGTYRWGIGERDEYALGLYHLETKGRPLYNHPWLINTGSAITSASGSIGTLVPTLPAKNYYGLVSDHLRTESSYGTFSHKRRFDQDSELKTTVRHGHYERDLLASAIRFTNITTLSTLGNSTALTRSPKARRAESDLTQIQSDYTTSFEALGHRHRLFAGVDYSDEKALRNNNATAGLSYAALGTTVGTPNDGQSITDTRALALNHFRARNIGLYAQDTLSLTSAIKVVVGLRMDRFSAQYTDTSGNRNERNDTLWSPRIGAIWQPADDATYYVSYGTSYNTSGDTYQFALGSFAAGSHNARTANTSPEKSRNIEIGSKLELFEKKTLLGIAFFHSQKYNERNTDPDSAASQMLLSGQRHASGMEFNFAGRITPAWEVFFNHTWIPRARIDVSNQTLSANGTGAQVQGDRSALTPKHSASLWTTWRLHPQWRMGAGLNHRSEQNPEGARHVTAPAFTTVDAMAEYTLSDATLLKLNITNLGNQLYADSLYRGFYMPGAPRRVELSLKTLF
ncbi:TonB-dependent siderophore receptor [Limnohabitans sp. Hippo3]|uniref:TonB-dependent receptor n=1 Tax=Limnohabitans sp. Hippo3 TaxID=1597956 RepID=UPI000D3D9295|nr:TonB-dependent siderophore receptor [Limnohabitans sp. Hippo3]PUE43418.1 TonB-dependent siderophore receptor [Limnohabitans sp. Hippo3]